MSRFHAKTRGRLAGVVVSIAMFLSFAAAHPEQVAKDPIQWAVRAIMPEKPLQPGDTFKVELLASIEAGWHLYSTDQTEGGPIPTRISLPPDQPFKLAGAIESSEPKTAMDPNFNLMTEYYEEQAAFWIPVKVAADAAAGKSQFRVQVSYQTCNDQLCLPPKTVKLALEVTLGSDK